MRIATVLLFTAPSIAAQDVVLQIDGANVLSQIGRGAGIGDVTGDGVPDLALVEDLGQATGRLLFVSGADGVAFDEIVSPDFSQALPRVAGLGDFDGDGVCDVLVGDPIDAQTLSRDGEAKVISGASREVIAVFPGPVGQERWIGWRVAAPGDVDGDGFADALITGRVGGAQVRFGPDGSRVRTHSTFGGFHSVSGVGDVNSDGLPDYAVGSPQYWADGTPLQIGALDIYSGVDGSLIRRLVGEEGDDHLGAASAAAGDVNGDGYGDVLVGLPGGREPSHSTDGGTARVYSGFDGLILWEESRPEAMFNTNFGIGTFGGSDFTGDGIVDWAIINARTDGGRGTIDFYDGATQQVVWRRHGADFGSFYSLAVFFPGDMNSDGIVDMAYGDWAEDPNGVNSGGVLRILAGAPGYAYSYCDANLNSSGRRASIGLDGPVSVGNNELTLEVTGASPSTFGLFYYGTEPRQFAFGDGFRCVGGNTQRLFPPIVIGDGGRAYRALDFTLPPVAPGGPSPIEAGSTRFFQFWFRDSAAGGTGFNLSDGVEVLFTP